MSEALDKLRECVSDYHVLVGRADKIADGAPFHSSHYNEDINLRIEGDEAVLYWTEYDSEYGNEDKETRFLASLLLMEPDEFSAWKALETTADQKRREEALATRRTEAAAEKEASDRAQLVALKHKYEGGPPPPKPVYTPAPPYARNVPGGLVVVST